LQVEWAMHSRLEQSANPLPGETPTQNKVLVAFWKYTLQHRTSPSHEDVGKLAGISKYAARQALLRLERRGLVVKIPVRYRPFQLTPEGLSAAHSLEQHKP